MVDVRVVFTKLSSAARPLPHAAAAPPGLDHDETPNRASELSFGGLRSTERSDNQPDSSSPHTNIILVFCTVQSLRAQRCPEARARPISSAAIRKHDNANAPWFAAPEPMGGRRRWAAGGERCSLRRWPHGRRQPQRRRPRCGRGGGGGGGDGDPVGRLPAPPRAAAGGGGGRRGERRERCGAAPRGPRHTR